MSITAIKTHFANWRGWELNPVVVKELRQAVRSWAVTGMLLLFLLVLFITTLVFLIDQSFEVSANTQLGGDIFQTFMIILSGASIMFIPLYVGIRMAAERQENNNDLLYISTLSPARIIWGKFLCGAYMTLLFFSACMPFMAFTNLLRGVDLPTVFFILAFLFMAVCAANQLAIFIACLPLSRPFKSLFALGEFFLSFWLIGGVVFSSIAMMRSGIGSMMAERTFWMTTFTVAGIVAATGGLLFVLSVALISPPSANRALLPRIYITVFWLLGGLLAGDWAWHKKDPAIIFVWTVIGTMLLVASLVVTISNNDQLSVRVQRRIPQSRPLRAVAFVFFNGAAGGLIWVFLLTFLTFLGTAWAFSASAARTSVTKETYSSFLQTYPPLLIYIFAYALTALFIQRKFLPPRLAKITGVLALIVAAIAAMGPNIILFFMNRLSWKTIEHLQLGNASNLFVNLEPEQKMAHLLFASGWLLLALVLNARWFATQVGNFHPPEKVEVPPVISAIPPANSK